MEIFLLRHAETPSNKAGVLAEDPDEGLTEHGRWQTEAIVSSLLSLQIDAVLCSPFRRALDTARPFAEAASLQIAVHPCLAEGQLVLDTSTAHEQPLYVESSSGHLHPEAGESAGAFLFRVQQAQQAIISEPAEKVLVVTHGHMLRELINVFLALPAKTRFPHANCGLSHLSMGQVTSVGFINRVLCRRS